MKRILDKSFIYINSDKTDIRATFRRVREHLQAEAERERINAAERLHKVISVKRGSK